MARREPALNGNFANARPNRPRTPRRQPPSCCASTIGSIAMLTLNRPAARNSLSEAPDRRAAREHCSDIRDDNSVRAVVIAANGPAFSAGHDMKELTARRSDADRGRAYFAHDHERLQRHDAGDRASAAAGHRRRAGRRHRGRLPAGGELRSRGRLAKPRRFATPGVDIGLFCSTPMVALSRNVPRKQAMEMLLTGELIAADDAPRTSASSTASCRRHRTRRGDRAGAEDRARNPPIRSRSARRRSTARPK